PLVPRTSSPRCRSPCTSRAGSSSAPRPEPAARATAPGRRPGPRPRAGVAAVPREPRRDCGVGGRRRYRRPPMRHRRAAALLLVTLLAAAACSDDGSERGADDGEAPVVRFGDDVEERVEGAERTEGSDVGDVELVGFDDRPVRLADYEGRPLVVN